MTAGGSEHSRNSENFTPKIGTVQCSLKIINFFKDLKTKYFDKHKILIGRQFFLFSCMLTTLELHILLIKYVKGKKDFQMLLHQSQLIEKDS